MGHFTKGLWSTRERKKVTSSQMASSYRVLSWNICSFILPSACLQEANVISARKYLQAEKGEAAPPQHHPCHHGASGVFQPSEGDVLLSHPVYCLPGAEVEPGFPLLLGKCSICHRAALDPGLGCFCSFLSSHVYY